MNSDVSSFLKLCVCDSTIHHPFRSQTVQFDDYPRLQLQTLDASFKGGLVLALLEVIYLNQKNYKNHTFNVLKEYLLDVQIVNYCPKNFYLVEPMNGKIGILKASGLVQLWMERYIDRSYIKIKQQQSGLRVMKVQQLLGGFQILLIGSTIATFAFGIELSTHACKIARKKLADSLKYFLLTSI